MESPLIVPTTPPPRVPRRTPKACKQCRAAKIRCSGKEPCDRCVRRRTTCVFPIDEPHVSVPERYLLELQRRVTQSSSASAPASGSDADSEIPSQAQLRPNKRRRKQQDTGDQIPDDPTSDEPQAERQDDASRNLPVGEDNANDLSSNVPLPHNPLIARNLSYVFDGTGRPRYLGPTSTWGFCRRAFTLLEGHTPSSDGTTAPLNLDGTAFRLRWQPKASPEQSDLKGLPAVDYALYLYNAVKFHLGELFGIVDEAYFMMHFDSFQQNPLETAQTQNLWFVQYLLIQAYGKAFFSGPGHAGTIIAGSDYASRAMSLLPDMAQMHDEGLHAIEVLALFSLYFQSIDMRATAYQMIGSAVRLCYVEGIQLEIFDNVLNSKFAERCNTTWWVVYALEQELSALMGAPPTIPESCVTMPLPTERSSSLSSKALALRVRLSRLITNISSTLYGLAEGLGSTFVRATTSVLHQLADASLEMDAVVTSLNESTQGELPHMFRHVTLSYHHCIVLATRPLVMWLLILNVPPTNVTSHDLPDPIARLLQVAIQSATTNLMMLKHLADNGGLETFLPSQLEYAFSSALLLYILEAILPTYVSDSSWRNNIHIVLDVMVKRKNTVAELRQAELDRLNTLLWPLSGRHLPLVEGTGTEQAQTASSLAMEQSTNADPEQMRNTMSDPATGVEGDDMDDMYMPWDMLDNPLATDPGMMLDLAEQFETGDLPSSFFFVPQP